MDLDTLEFLLSPEGGELLNAAASVEGSLLTRITALRKHYPTPSVSAAIELLELRKRARTKFTRADEMFFTRESLEQASGEVISRYRAERYEHDSRVLDLACGIGGDTIGLASRCLVTAVDLDPVRIAMARRNIEVYGLSHRVEFVCADVTTFPLEGDAAFLDPSRRTQGRRVIRLSQLSPPLDLVHRLIHAVPDCAIKLSPASDDAELESLDAEIEFLSESGECKEALAWFGRFKTAEIRATILPERVSLESCAVPKVPVSEFGKYLYEPDPCVIRAHLVEHLAVKIGTWKIDERIAYLSSDRLCETPFAASFEILESMPFNLKIIKERLRIMGAGRVIVKKRGVPFEPREIELRLRLHGDREFILVLTRVLEKPWALICLRASSGGIRADSVE